MYCNDQKEAFLFKRGGANNNYQSFQHRHLPTQQKPSDTYDKSKPSNSQTTQDDSEVISVSSDIHINYTILLRILELVKLATALLCGKL